jgi:diacylglycerol O-acyltransferase
MPAPGSMADLLKLAETIGTTPLDRSRPLWVGTLVEGLEGGRAAYVLLVHHCLMDGFGGMQLFKHLHSSRREPSPDKPVPESEAPDDLDPVRLAFKGVAERARQLPGGSLRVLGAARRSITSPGQALAYVASLRRVVSAASAAPPSPLLGRQAGRAWRYGVIECGLDELKSSGRAVGGSLNDAYVSALLGGIRRYHLRLDMDVGDIRMVMPVSIRRPDDPMGGNQFTGAFFAAPAGTADPAERIAAIRGAVLSVREEPALTYLGALAPVLNRAPSAVLGLLLGAAAPRVDLSASNVPGIPHAVYSAGAQLERMFVFGPLPGVSMLATLVSYNGTCCIGINCDGAVFEDPDLLWTCMQEGLDEVLELGVAA